MQNYGYGTATKEAEIRVRGKNIIVPSATIQDRTVVITRRFPGIAALKDEEFAEEEAFRDPDSFWVELKQSGLGADLFTFVQVFPDIEPRYSFRMEWDNVAAIPIKSYADWHANQINGNARKILKRSLRRGVAVEQVNFDDDLVRGIVAIYNETPVRQGRAFWHYGKDFETVKREAGTFPDRSLFLGAFYEGKLIGFIKMVSVGKVARLMHILSMAAHMDKVPTNNLIAKAVEVCDQKGFSHLTYGKFIYGNAGYTSLTEFKVRNGFQKFMVPRYYVPLTVYGQLALKLGFHQGLKNMLPPSMVKLILNARAKFNSLRSGNTAAVKDETATGQEDAEQKEKAPVAG